MTRALAVLKWSAIALYVAVSALLTVGGAWLGLGLNLAFLLVVISAAVGPVVKAVAAWRKRLHRQFWREPHRHPAHLVQALLRLTTWTLAVVVVWVAILPVQLGDSYDTVRAVLLGAFVVRCALELAPHDRVRIWTNLPFAVIAATATVQLVNTFRESPDPVVVSSPFAEPFTVFHGGGSALVNYHQAYSSQANALDVVIVRDGLEHDGPPDDLESWHCYGTPVLAPVAGTVARVHRGEKDMPIGVLGADGGHPAGNHVVLRHADQFVLLAHLKADSILVEEGQDLAAGVPVAQCGNSGNTSQPHLHIQAQTLENLFADGNRTFPIAFQGTRIRNGVETAGPVQLRRNDVLRPH